MSDLCRETTFAVLARKVLVTARAGVVYLVGAGPGDPGLMTARSLELIAAADSILYDRLIPSAALAGAATTRSSSTSARSPATHRSLRIGSTMSWSSARGGASPWCA